MDTSRIFLRCQAATPGGVTYEEAISNAREALALYLETLADHGDPIPEETTHEPVTLGVTVRTPIIV